MNPVEIIKRCRDISVELILAGDKLKIRGTQPMPDDLREALNVAKSEVMAELRRQKPYAVNKSVPDELEQMLELGRQLKAGKIKAVHCGITGNRCTACQGVPCLGSMPWEDQP
jgi:hypothetical protein